MGIKNTRRDHLIALIKRPDILTQAAFAERVNLPPAFVSHLVRGRNLMGDRVAKKIEKALGLPDGYMDEPASGTDAAPPLKSVPMSSWDLRLALADRQKRGILKSCAAVYTARPVSDQTYALTVRGDSMAPRYPDGCIIVVDPQAPKRNGSHVVAQRPEDSEAIFRIYVEEGGQQYLRALNTAYGPQQPLGAFVIHGVVVQAQFDVE